MFVYYSGSGYLVNRPSSDHLAAKEITHGTYQGIFALSSADEKELRYTKKVTVNYLEITNHEDAPELADVLRRLSTELEDEKSKLHSSRPINLKFESILSNLNKLGENRKKHTVFMMTAPWGEPIRININSNEKHYETEEGNKLSILDSAQIEEPIATDTNTDKSKLDKPLRTRERKTLLTIIAALCTQNGINPTERGAAQRIREITEINGTPIDDETIRKYLSEISEM